MNVTGQDKQRRPRVLLLAYCCSPFHGSESGMGWSFVRHAAQYCDTWAICEEQTYGVHVRRYLAEHGDIPGLQFAYVPERAWAGPMWAVPGLGYLSYHWWHGRALRVARSLHERIGFDLVHQVNIIGFREPGLLWKLGVPFVWGPVGGVNNYPWRFLSEATFSSGLLEAGRTLANKLQLRFNRRIRHVARRAAALVAASSANRESRRPLYPKSVCRALPPHPACATRRAILCGFCGPAVASRGKVCPC
jgi:hypothetical protein